MDLTKIKSAVFNQLNNVEGLYSLKVQNHIYGCFIVMEDIVQSGLDISGSRLIAPTFTFDYDVQFSEIGIRYGFAMDTKLLLDVYSVEYKQGWLELFRDIGVLNDITHVDKIENTIIQIIQKNIKVEDAYFINALETGALGREWIDKVITLLNQPLPTTPPTTPSSTPNDSDDEIKKTGLSAAATEKPMHKPTRRLAKTRRAHKPEGILKKSLSKTRRHMG
jgi:hypothetical protein